MTDQPGDRQQGPSEKMPGPLSPPAMRHDALFREAFSDPERADVLLRWMLPASIVSSFADEPLEVLPTTFVDDSLVQSQCDVLLKVRLKTGKDACFPILLEHKSSNVPWTIVQVGGYMFRVWQRLIEHDRLKPGELPPILPLVFYHGEGSWTAPTFLKEAMDFMGLPAGEFPLGIWYILCNIRKVPLEELPQHPEVLPVLIAFRGAQPELMVPLLGAMGVHSKLGRQLLVYALRAGGRPTMDELISALPGAQRNEMEAEMDSVIETSYREGKTEGRYEGRSEGRSEGLSEGLAKGRTEGLANAVLHVLNRRFGPLDPNLRNRVSSASFDQLQQWLGAAVDAHSPEEALGLPNSH